MANMDLRVRLFGAALSRVPGANVSKLNPEQIRQAQARRLGHNPATDLLFGALAKDVQISDLECRGPESDLPLRLYQPAGGSAEARPLILNFHGGSWVFGTLDQYDSFCGHVARRVDAVVLSVDYRLAPEHPFPAAPEDCYAALVWAAEHAEEWGADPSRIGVMGDSAGGNLAAVVSLLARDRSGPVLRHQTLVYPATDLTLSSPSLTSNADKPILTQADVEAYHALYLGDADARDLRASPLLADDHSGLPPALIQVAEHDPIRDDGVRYADTLQAAGVPVRLTEYVGMPHGYMSLPRICRAAPQALWEICAEQRLALVSPEPAAAA
jgi:acetyl esterase